jgi:hypothetical protein
VCRRQRKEKRPLKCKSRIGLECPPNHVPPFRRLKEILIANFIDCQGNGRRTRLAAAVQRSAGRIPAGGAAAFGASGAPQAARDRVSAMNISIPTRLLLLGEGLDKLPEILYFLINNALSHNSLR